MSGIISDNVGRATGLIKAAGGGGKIGQVLQTVHTGTESGSGNTAATIPNFTVAITPAATSSKMLVSVFMFLGSNSSYGVYLQLFRDTTQLFMGDTAGSRPRISTGVFITSARSLEPLSFCYLDSPSSTSELDYSCKWYGQSSAVFKMNRTSEDNAQTDYDARGAAAITVMEVLA